MSGGATRASPRRSRSRVAGVRRLVLFHHDPLHTDGDLLQLQARARELWNGEGEPPELAREGEWIAVAPA